MEDGMLSLWLAYPGEGLAPEDARRCFEMLSKGDRARSERIILEKVRQEYLVAHTMMRRALSCGISMPPETWQSSTNLYGKPEVEPDCGLPSPVGINE